MTVLSTGNIILPSDTSNTGKKLRTRSRLESANTVHAQGVFLDELPTYYCYNEVTLTAGASASNIVFGICNNSSTDIIKLVSAQVIPLQISAVTGVTTKIELIRTKSLQAGGTAIVPFRASSTDSTLGAGIVVAGGTVTASTVDATLMSRMTVSEEMPATFPAVTTPIELLPPIMKETKLLTLNYNGTAQEGVQIKMSTTGTQVASVFGVAVIFTVE